MSLFLVILCTQHPACICSYFAISHLKLCSCTPLHPLSRSISWQTRCHGQVILRQWCVIYWFCWAVLSKCTKMNKFSTNMKTFQRVP